MKHNLCLQLQQMSYDYGTNQILKDLDLTLHGGQITVLLGANGAGKTTLMHLIAGMRPLRQGSILLNDQKIDWEDVAYKQRMGYMMEFPFQYPFLTVLEMMRLVGQLRCIPKKQLEERIMCWLHKLGLESYGLYPIHTLSQGTAQRVALASTFLHEPDILILDEPTNGLDPAQVIVVREILQAYCKRGTIILCSTHIMGLAEKIAHQVAILHNGQLMYQGDKTEDMEDLYLSYHAHLQ